MIQKGQVLSYFTMDFSSYLPMLYKLGWVLCAVLLAFWLEKTFYRSLLLRSSKGGFFLDEVSLRFLHKLLVVIGACVILLLVLDVFGLNISPLLTFGGIGAAAIAFASKDVCANFFSGLMLHITRPFTIQDQVELPGRKLVGHIEEIGWCLTLLRDIHLRPIYLPNSVFSQEPVINLSRITHRFIEETVRWRYTKAEEVGAVVEQIRLLVKTHPEIDADLPVYVFLKTMTSLFVEVEIKAYTRGPVYADLRKTKQEILLKAYELVPIL